ncbi:mucin-22-like [Haliotis rubra]|uniref:mucin-22-like n=1 Tax=Haliotis rubra TaxID=36100 RepID=UPI001EE56250|nr:mucin-22-like [Haliotis rubra]
MAHHSKCVSVVSTESQMCTVKSQLRRMKENILQRQEEIKENLGKKKSKANEETARYLQLESDIRALSHKAVEMIKSKENILVKELKSISEKHVRQLQADISSDETSVARCQQQVERIDQVLQSESDMDVCTLYQDCEADDAVADADLRDEDRIAKITLRLDTGQLFKALVALQLGEIDVLYERMLDLKAGAETQGTSHVLELKAGAETQGTPHTLNLKAGAETQGTPHTLNLKAGAETQGTSHVLELKAGAETQGTPLTLNLKAGAETQGTPHTLNLKACAETQGTPHTLSLKACAETQGTSHVFDLKAGAETQGTPLTLNMKAGAETQGTPHTLNLKAGAETQGTPLTLNLKAGAETQGTPHTLNLKARPETQGTSHVLDLKATSEVQGSSNVLDLKATPVLLETINVRTAEDRNKALLIDVIVMIVNDTDIVIITDYSNKNVKSFYNRNDKPCYNRLSLDSDPWSLTQLTSNQIAVTVPKIKQIVIADASPDMARLSTISTSKQYRGITALTSSTVAVSTTSPPGVDVLDSEGNVLRSTSLMHHSPSILKYPYFLSLTNTGNILVSDSGTKYVLCLKPDGDIVFTSIPTGDSSRHGPQGVTTTITGDILVTYFDLNSVVHLTETGQFVKTLLTERHDIDKPRGLCVGGQGRVYICNSFKGQIKVFKC